MSLAHAARSMIEAFEELQRSQPPPLRSVFISYAREDRVLAERMARQLAADGFEPWWDDRIDPGDHFDDLIARALDEAFAVVVIWTVNSLASQWVKWEAQQGLKGGKLVPVAADGLDMRDIRPPFCNLNTLRLGQDARLREALVKLGARA